MRPTEWDFRSPGDFSQSDRQALMSQRDLDVYFTLDKLASSNLSFSEKMALLTTFTQNPHRNATYHFDRAIRIVRDQVEKLPENKSDDQILLFKQFIGGLTDALPAIVKNDHLLWICDVTRLARELPEVQTDVEHFIISATRYPEIPIADLESLLRTISLNCAITILEEFSTKRLDWMSTYTVDDQLKCLKTAIHNEKNLPNQNQLAAIKQLFSNYRKNLPLFQDRNHDIFLKKGLLGLLEKYPRFYDIGLDLLLDLDDIRLEEAANDPIIDTRSGEEKIINLFSAQGNLSNLESSNIVRKLRHDPKSYRALQLTRKILESDSTDNGSFNNVLKDVPLEQVVDDEFVINLVNLMCREPKKFLFQIGLLLSKIPFDRISPENRSVIATHLTDLEINIKAGHGGWCLCSEAEPLLAKSIRLDAVLLVNDSLLMKFVGKPSALCIRSYSTRQGTTFVKGNWYAPVDYLTRVKLNQSFDNSLTRVDIPNGEWALMRAIGPHRDKKPMEILSVIENYCQTMPHGKKRRSKNSRALLRQNLVEGH